MDPILLTQIIASTLKLATDVSTMALQHGALSPADVQKLWDAQRGQWGADWDQWLAQQVPAAPV